MLCGRGLLEAWRWEEEGGKTEGEVGREDGGMKEVMAEDNEIEVSGNSTVIGCSSTVGCS